MRRAVLILLAALAGCGGGGSSQDPGPTAEALEAVESQKSTVRPASSPVAKFSSVLFIGNSLTHHPPNPALGWTGDWGMASSSRDKDYVHLTAAALGLVPQVFNISGLESDQVTYTPFIPDATRTIDAATAVLVELGDNVPAASDPAFLVAYGKLLDATKPAAVLVCLSTWWARPALDVKLKAACEARGGAYVYIGDIYPTRLDVVGTFSTTAVDRHPHDWGMAAIAQRAIKALR